MSLSQVDLTGGVQSTGLPAPAITAINSATTVQLDRWEDDDQYCEEALWAQHSAPVLGEFDRLGIAEANKRQQLVEAQRRAQERVAERERGKERKQQPGTIHAATATPPGSRGEPEVVEEKEEPKRDPLIGLPQGMSRAAMEEAHRRAKEQYQASQSPMSPQARNCLTPGDVVTMKNLLQAMVEAVALNEAARALENVPLALEEYQATCFQMEAEKERADAAVRKAEERWQKERARTARRRVRPIESDPDLLVRLAHRVENRTWP